MLCSGWQHLSFAKSPLVHLKHNQRTNSLGRQRHYTTFLGGDKNRKTINSLIQFDDGDENYLSRDTMHLT